MDIEDMFMLDALNEAERRSGKQSTFLYWFIPISAILIFQVVMVIINL